MFLLINQIPSKKRMKLRTNWVNLRALFSLVGILNQAIELPRAMEKLKINSDREFEIARERFELARETATTAFRNEVSSIEDQIFGTKLYE